MYPRGSGKESNTEKGFEPCSVFHKKLWRMKLDLSRERDLNPSRVLGTDYESAPLTFTEFWRMKLDLSREWDLNPRPADYESAALPLSYLGLSNVVASAHEKSADDFLSILNSSKATLESINANV
jgi:hypothetical protein